MNIKSVLNLVYIGSITQLFSTPALSVPVYPNEIQACIATSACTNPALIQQESTFSAYLYSDGAILKYLFEYNLWPSSNESTNFITTELSGSVWVSANASYDLTVDRHFFDLYLDGVTPTPSNIWVFDSDGLDVQLSIPTTDLLAGSSFFRIADLGGGIFQGDLGTHGDQGQIDNHSFVPCLASTCEVGAVFNLLNMQYQQLGLTASLVLNPTDERGVLYSQYRDFLQEEGFYLAQSYQVTPIPPAIWLFGSGLIFLFSVTRCKSRA